MASHTANRSAGEVAGTAAAAAAAAAAEAPYNEFPPAVVSSGIATAACTCLWWGARRENYSTISPNFCLFRRIRIS